MTQPRDLATKCKIGPIEFWARATQSGGERDIVHERALGKTGGKGRDQGEGPRKEVIQAEVEDATWIRLENLRLEARVVTCVHPLFGVMEARVKSCGCRATQQDMVDVEIVLIEDGERTVTMAPAVISLPSAQSAFTGASSALNDGLDNFAASFDLDAGLGDISDPFIAAVDTFGDLVSDAVDGVIDPLDLAGGLDTLVDSASTFIGGLGQYVESAVDSARDAIDYVSDDLVYGVVGAAQQCVQSAMGDVSRAWHSFKTMGPTSLDRIMQDWLGTDDEETQERVLAANPEIIDVTCIDAGIEMRLPFEP